MATHSVAWAVCGVVRLYAMACGGMGSVWPCAVGSQAQAGGAQGEWQGLSGQMLFPGPLPELHRPGLRP